MTRVVGYCVVGHHIRYVEVTSLGVAEAAVSGVIKGVCDSCKREMEGEWVGGVKTSKGTPSRKPRESR